MTVDGVRAGPVPDEDSAPYWRGLRLRQVLLQKCASCALVRFPPMPGCPGCGSGDADPIVARGSGRVYSWIVVPRPLGTLTEADVPCTIVTVELDEGCRLLGRLEGAGGAVADLPVVARFIDHDDWTELAFAPAGQD